MIREFAAQLRKGHAPGAWTCVVMDDVAELFGTRGLVKIIGAIDSERFVGALMAQGDGTHRLPVNAALRKTIGKEAGDTVHIRIDERIGWPQAARRGALRIAQRPPVVPGGWTRSRSVLDQSAHGFPSCRHSGPVRKQPLLRGARARDP